MEDSGIIDLFFARDERAIRETDGKYGPRLRRYASRLVEDEGDGEGCVNDTYLQAWERIPPTRPVVYEAFLFKMLRHICLDLLDYRRAGKRSACLVELSEELLTCLPHAEGVEDGMMAKQLATLIDAFLRKQKEEARITFVRRYFHGQSIAEIARAGGIGESRVKATLFRMRNKLRRVLEEEGYVL
ncbi:MAG: RNA polymerase sigma factor [Clostridia bacterium]|nr:RNA polymerase sigma factor [Clostridia bacterium]